MGGATAVPAAPSQRHGPHERLLPGAPRRDRCRRPAAARVQDPARAVDPHTCAPVRGGVVRVRRTARRPQQGDGPRGGALHVAPRAPAPRPLRARRRLGPGGQHPPACGADRHRGPVLRRVGDHRDAGLHAVELLLHRALGVRRSRSQARHGPPHGALLPHEQRGARAERTSARAAHVRAGHSLPGLERPVVGGPHARALRARRHLDLGEGAAERGRATRLHLRHPRDRHREVGRPAARAGALPDRRADRRARHPGAGGEGGPQRPLRRPLPRRSRSPRVRCRDRSRRSHRGDRIAAASAVPARALHERRRADSSLDVRRARLRARARGMPGERRGRLPGHRQDGYREDDDEPAHARQPPLLVPVRRSDARESRRPGVDLSQATHDQPAHPEGGEDAVALAAGAHRPRGSEPAALTFRAALRARHRPHTSSGRDDQRDRPDDRPSAQVPRGAPGAGRRGGPRGSAEGDGRDPARRRGRRFAGRVRGARDPDAQLRGRLRLPSVFGDRGIAAPAQRR